MFEDPLLEDLALGAFPPAATRPPTVRFIFIAPCLFFGVCFFLYDPVSDYSLVVPSLFVPMHVGMFPSLLLLLLYSSAVSDIPTTCPPLSNALSHIVLIIF